MIEKIEGFEIGINEKSKRIIKNGPFGPRIRPWGDFDMENSIFNTKWEENLKNTETQPN